MTSGEENVKWVYLNRIKINCKWQKIESVICTFSLLGYALDPSLDNQVTTKYIGSVEEAEKNQGIYLKLYVPVNNCLTHWLQTIGIKLVFYLAWFFFKLRQ